MTRDRSFPLIFLPHAEAAIPAGAGEAGQKAKPVAARQGAAPSDLDRLYEASIAGVRSAFPFLSETDIAYPPHHWFDAALARQIALHLLIEHFDVPKRRVAKELARSRGSIWQAVNTVDDRLQHPDFRRAYHEMVSRADEIVTGKGKGDDAD